MDLDGEAVDVRAFRGTRPASVYREYIVGEGTFVRMLELGREKGLPILSLLDQYGSHEFDRMEAAQLLGEVEAVQASPGDDELAQHLLGIANVVRWCADAPDGGTWLTIIGP
jgi:hypothetical protein